MGEIITLNNGLYTYKLPNVPRDKDILYYDDEIWRDVVGYEGLYAVSNLGRMKRLLKLSKAGHCLAEKVCRDTIRNGYFVSSIRKGKGVVVEYRHRLIAIAFVSNPLQLPIVNHKDGIKTNNRIENLEWVTHSQNTKHAFAANLMSHKGTNNSQCKLTEEQAREIKHSDLPSRYLSEKFGVGMDNIRAIQRGSKWKHVI
ncbi:MAG: hypothetical protein NVS1B13_20960 [Flavisolibacter sp.]